jgi:serine/threonine-protein kinase RsbW
MGARTSLKLVLPSDVRLVDFAHAIAEKLAEAVGFDPASALNVGLAVREAVINAIVHGNRQDPSLDVVLKFEAGQRGVRIQVLDRGAGFDPARLPDPTAPENLLRDSGRGVLLMRSFVDGVRFRYREGRGMEVTLIKNLASLVGRATGPAAMAPSESYGGPER